MLTRRTQTPNLKTKSWREAINQPKWSEKSTQLAKPKPISHSTSAPSGFPLTGPWVDDSLHLGFPKFFCFFLNNPNLLPTQIVETYNYSLVDIKSLFLAQSIDHILYLLYHKPKFNYWLYNKNIRIM